MASIQQKREHPKEKLQLHSRNKHRERYNFKELIDSCPELSQFVRVNDYGDESIDFFDPEAVKMLNKALLKYFYGINSWNIPQGYLCPPIPGRADYLHYVADLLGSCNKGVVPTGNRVRCLDIGVGANCVYPIVGTHEYGWSFVGSDIDKVAIQSASEIIECNESLKDAVELRWQPNSTDIFRGIIQNGEHFDIVICNPPFHSSAREAQLANLKKISNLSGIRITKPAQNFGGQRNELWCEGGEERFVGDMVFQSKEYAASCCWFSTLISKQANVDKAYKYLKNVEASEIRTIQMGQGNKISRIVAWTFLADEAQKQWAKTKWSK